MTECGKPINTLLEDLRAEVRELPPNFTSKPTMAVVHCLDATYPIVDVHKMSDGSIGIEVALHESGETCNCSKGS